jgi:hypothetical protein
METNMNEAEKNLKKALSIGLKSDSDKAAVKLNLAGIAAAKRKPKEAQMLLMEAKRLDTKGLLKNDIKNFEKAIKNPKVVYQRH